MGARPCKNVWALGCCMREDQTAASARACVTSKKASHLPSPSPSALQAQAGQGQCQNRVHIRCER